jgi:3-phosphoshikimate 1-carboxyvinyltransferase
VSDTEQLYPESLPLVPVRRPIDADIVLPGSKSITNRVLIVAALANGESVLEHALFSDDTRYMQESLASLGIEITADGLRERFVVQGRGGTIPASQASLFVGNSGTSARFLTALVALGNGTYVIDGVERMRQRPIAPLLSALNDFGVDAKSEFNNGCPPIIVSSRGLPGGETRMAGDTSSQYFTALLMVAPVTNQGMTITVEGDLVSKPYLDMTIATMRNFGVEVTHENYARFIVPGGQKYSARAYPIEPDASAASYFFALAAVTGGRIRVNNLGCQSVQGDLDFVDVLEQMGCIVDRDANSIEVAGPGRLSGVDVDMNAISDTMPTLAAIAPLADGPVTIRNVEHVRHKETDRISAVVTELRRLGIDVEERQDGITIQPGTPSRGTVLTYDDHRMAMSFAILGSVSEGIVIDDPGCVAKTFPGFFQHLKATVDSD